MTLCCTEAEYWWPHHEQVPELVAHVQLGGPDSDKLRMIHILKASMYKASAPVHLQHCRGTFQAGSGLMGGGEHPPDTFLSTPGFLEGVARHDCVALTAALRLRKCKDMRRGECVQAR